MPIRRWVLAIGVLLAVFIGHSRLPAVHGHHAGIAAAAEDSVIFNTKSHKYHRPGCSAAHACTVNCITISRSEAIKRGGVPCGLCGG